MEIILTCTLICRIWWFTEYVLLEVREDSQIISLKIKNFYCSCAYSCISNRTDSQTLTTDDALRMQQMILPSKPKMWNDRRPLQIRNPLPKYIKFISSKLVSFASCAKRVCCFQIFSYAVDVRLFFDYHRVFLLSALLPSTGSHFFQTYDDIRFLP